jgi:hypothetical protein
MLLATALVAVLAFGLSGDAAAASKPGWFAAWGFSQQGLAIETLTNATVRMITRPTLAGSAVRVTIENTCGQQPVTIGAASVGRRANGALMVPGSIRPLTFNGAGSVVIPSGGKVVSDSAALTVSLLFALTKGEPIPWKRSPTPEGVRRRAGRAPALRDAIRSVRSVRLPLDTPAALG